MKPTGTDVLVWGASVAGPTLASWLRRRGFIPTVVEQTRRCAPAWAGRPSTPPRRSGAT
jgi:2-polyprenyl-6-methoxyphenol hydroxylase-like FAD-dependent oxidoreductase